MIEDIKISGKAMKDLKSIPKNQAGTILDRIETLKPDLKGDVKRLTNFTPEYRLRVGDFRILFEIENNVIIIYRIKHRKDSYR